MNSAFVGYKELSRYRRVLSTGAELDLHNSSYPTQPRSFIAKHLSDKFAYCSAHKNSFLALRVIHELKNGRGTSLYIYRHHCCYTLTTSDGRRVCLAS